MQPWDEAQFSALEEAVQRSRNENDGWYLRNELRRCGWDTFELPPLPQLRQEILRSVQVATGGHWIWTGTINRGGYGELYFRKVHRLAYTAWCEPIPKGLVIDHLCCIRACCNPLGEYEGHAGHLEPVTRVENTRRAILRGQQFPEQKCHQGARRWCVRGHKFDQANTGIDGAGKRYCKTCRAGFNRRHRKEVLGQADRKPEWHVNLNLWDQQRTGLTSLAPWVSTGEALKVLAITKDSFASWRQRHKKVLTPQKRGASLRWSLPELELLLTCRTTEPWSRKRK